jgi:hypothetical protein
MFARRKLSHRKQRRNEELLGAWVQTISFELAKHLHSEGFLNYRVSIYPHYPVHSSPQIAGCYVDQFFNGRLAELKYGAAWLTHVSFSMEDGVAQASYERQDGSYWCAEDQILI